VRRKLTLEHASKWSQWDGSVRGACLSACEFYLPLDDSILEPQGRGGLQLAGRIGRSEVLASCEFW
jgi:hypothetical protein